MNRPRATEMLTVAALAACAIAGLPASAAADDPGAAQAPAGPTGGAGYGGEVDPSVTVRVRRVAMIGRTVRFRGEVGAQHAGREVLVQRLDDAQGWVTEVTTTAQPDGTFAARWRASRAGRLKIRALVAVPPDQASASRSSRAVRLTIHRPARATFYGPGFYGRRTACQVRLTRRTLGVAHRGLPCGTKVSLMFGGRSVTVPVIDRGPYANGADWDLTAATAKRLGMTGTSTIGVLPLR